MYLYVLIFGGCLISASQSFSPSKNLSEPKTFKLIQNIVRQNYERTLRRQRQLLVDRNYPPLGHPPHPPHHPPVSKHIRHTRRLRHPQRTQRKIKDVQTKAGHGNSKSYSGGDIDRTFSVSKSTKNTLSTNVAKPTFLIKPAGMS